MTDIDEAFTLMGFGRMQICVFITCFLLQMWANNEQMGFAVVVAAATCDLEISNERVSWLMVCNFGAQMVLSLVWGEISDRYGRRKAIISTCPGALLASLLSAFMPEFWSFLVMRVLTGALLGGPVGVMMTYLGELTKVSLRPKVLNYSNYAFGLSLIQVPALAIVILPLKTGPLESWRALHLTSMFPGLCGTIAMLFLPESPKFYLSIHQEAKAMKTMERICRCNKGKHVTLATLGIESITQPRLETPDKGHCTKSKTLLTKYRNYMLLMMFIIVIHSGMGFGLPIWMLRIRVAMQSRKEGPTMCEHMRETTAARIIQCDLQLSDLLDVIIHGFVVLGFFIVTSLLLFILSRRVVMLSYIGIAIIGGINLNFARNNHLILICFFALIDAPLCCLRLLVTFLIDLIPTHLRGKAMAILFMMGRIGVLSTSVFVGYTLGWNCHATFNTLMIILAASGILVFMLPSDRRIQAMYKS
ncbi:putative transporter svop-1 [Drosophila serrata]|uniref:putative transporter svop-1 n=1 Tax=Drosophila serrata TaxID=7274 RepID=UPI000A1D12F6|nr:putative transporter svop-1 [Drosophila serrata]